MATFALVIWPLIAIALVRTYGTAKGLVLAIGLGYLFLPQAWAIAIPGFIDFDRKAAIGLGAFLGLVFANASAPRTASELGHVRTKNVDLVVYICVSLVAVGAVLTWITNREALVFSQRVVPAVGLYDLISILAGFAIVVAPFFLALRYLRTSSHHRTLLTVLVGLGIAYSFLVLWEIRFSPQLHRTLYGYFPHQWGQFLRGGGYRPLVFTKHALDVGFFLVTAILAALTLYRWSTGTAKRNFLFVAIWLFVVLLFSKTFGATLIVVFFGLLIMFASKRMIMRICAASAMFFLLFPAARQADLVPLDTFISMASSINEDRIGSLEFRIKHEDELLERALLKPIAGWGPWGRMRVRDERGHDLSVTDGAWIILLGEQGWFGYLGFFGLLAFPIVALSRLRRKIEISGETLGLAAIMAANFVYLVPNSTLTPLAWMAAGAIAAAVKYVAPNSQASGLVPDAESRATARSGPRYSRFERRERGRESRT